MSEFYYGPVSAEDAITNKDDMKHMGSLLHIMST